LRQGDAVDVPESWFGAAGLRRSLAGLSLCRLPGEGLRLAVQCPAAGAGDGSAHGGPAEVGEPRRIADALLGFLLQGDEATLAPRPEEDQLVALRACCSIWLPERDGLLLHAASVDLGDGRALVLCGPSEVGKTTIAQRLSARGLRVVSDEIAAVRGGRLFGHTFVGRLGDGEAPEEGLPLAALAFLSQAEPRTAGRALRLGPAAAARELLARTFLASPTSGLLGVVLATAARLLEQVPAFSLALPNDDRASGLALSICAPAAGPIAGSRRGIAP
jgi:hypothetical protein